MRARQVIIGLFLLLSVPSVAQIDENHTYNPRHNDDFGSGKLRINSRNIRLRDDHLWHAESAGLVYPMAGNVSLLSASRFGLSEHLELSTYLAADILRPSLYAKILWNVFDKKWYLTSRVNVANACLGMAIGKKFDVTRFIMPGAERPIVFELGHELLVSRAWFSDPNCSDGSVCLILTAGYGIYGGLSFSDTPNLRQAGFHFLANRGTTVLGNGFRSRLKLWADGRVNDRFMLHGGLSYHIGSFTNHHAFELQAEAEVFFSSRFSIKGGCLVSAANYTAIEKKAAIWPILDFTYFFGNRRLHSLTLFQRGVYHGGR